jgi:AmmeMemoRadiSam system protein A
MEDPQNQQPETPGLVPRRPELDETQQQRVFRAAGRRVAATVRGEPPEPMGAVLGEVAGRPLLGAFVSLKRSGKLRSCCGCLGDSIPLAEAVGHAAERAARDDPRFPPIAAEELDELGMEVWLLWNLEPVPGEGEARAAGFEIGKHGLQVARGAARGLLLPSVAVDHGLDAWGFLRQVCLKARLPADAWMDDDTALMRFQGYSIRGRLNPRPEEDNVEPGFLRDGESGA